MSRLFLPELPTSKMKGIRSQGSARGEGDTFHSTDKAEDFTHALYYPYIEAQCCTDIPYRHIRRCRDMLGGSRGVA